ncbi:chromosome segregation protein SMC, partial [bacterium]|nr:chromosome segregation protein SMC [bacterium]
SNVKRFIRMLREFAGRTQFIVITHNKVTMQATDRLYGVTMEESGISKVVSVRLDTAGKEVESEEIAYEAA